MPVVRNQNGVSQRAGAACDLCLKLIQVFPAAHVIPGTANSDKDYWACCAACSAWRIYYCPVLAHNDMLRYFWGT